MGTSPQQQWNAGLDAEGTQGGIAMRRIGIGLLTLGCCAVGSVVGLESQSYAQSFGTELHNTLMPASGGMGGVSIARPQDLTSAINGNPASLTQYRGTQFLFGGAWADPNIHLTQTSGIPVGSPDPLLGSFSAKSSAPGSPMANIGVTQDIDELGLPVTIGVAFVSAAGGAVDFRQVPASRGTNSALSVFSLPVSVGADLTDRWSIGTSMALGIALYNGPFLVTSSMTPDYALRGTLGTNYLLTEKTTVGAYYQTQQSYTFDNAFIVDYGGTRVVSDVAMDLPQNIGFGVANTSLMDGNLLLGVDVLYKLWDQASMYDVLYDNQWVVQLGSQLTRGKVKWRTGYVWAENPIDNNPAINIGGVVQPGGYPAVRYTQGLLAVTSQHRLTGGVGIVDLLPGIDADVMGGGMFHSSQQLGDYTNTSISSYWLGFGLTWRFNRGSCEKLPAPERWSN